MKKLALALVVSFVGCITVTPEMDRVRVTNNPDVVRGCRFIKNISFEGFWRVSNTDSLNLFRQKVVEAGGNVGYLTSETPVAGGAPLTGSSISGEAYSCGRSAASSGLLVQANRLLIKLLPELHRAEVNGPMWKGLDPDTRKREAQSFASQCPPGSDGKLLISIFDAETGEQLGQLGGLPPRQ